jgi:mannan endo-1,4-beta-mannosidase
LTPSEALYRNLHKVAQKGVLFGHQDTLAYGVGWKADPNKLDSDAYRICGKVPAIFIWDIGHLLTLFLEDLPPMCQ